MDYLTACERFALKPHRPLNETVRYFEALMRERFGDTQEEIDGLTQHHFAPGIYAREMLIPAGSCAVGKTHAHDHISILLEGDVTIATDDGMKRLQAPQIVHSKAGIKRVAYAHTDTRWLCIHPNEADDEDLQVLESKYIEPEPIWTLDHFNHLLED